MESRVRSILTDGSVPNLRGGAYKSLLRSTSWTMISLISAHAQRPESIDAVHSQKAIRRAMTALTQLPAEWAGSDNRFDHARWRSYDVGSGGRQQVHAEHPWSKSGTKKLIVGAVEAALARSAEPESIIDDVSQILDARIDTVLLPSSNLRSLGIVLETRGDGLGRYAEAVASGRLRLVDRFTGNILTSDQIMDEDNERSAKVQSAIHRIIMG